jgi:lysozyme family protein
MDTNWGHSIRFVMAQETRPSLEEHNAFRRSHFDPDLGDVGSASQQEIETIYRISYWMPYGPTLPSGLDLFFFDSAVTEGVLEATKGLQRALGVDPDGHIGIVTTEALITSIRTRRVAEVIDRYAVQRRVRVAVGADLKSTSARVDAALAAAKELIRY